MGVCEVIRAEDARLLDEMDTLCEAYTDLYQLNREILAEYHKREQNHSNLLTSLKQVNEMIQKAASLRRGRPRTQLIAESRYNIIIHNIIKMFF